MKKSQKLTVGRIVHFRFADRVRPAMVVGVTESNGQEVADLRIFLAASDDTLLAEYYVAVGKVSGWKVSHHDAFARATRECDGGMLWRVQVPYGTGNGQWAWPGEMPELELQVEGETRLLASR